MSSTGFITGMYVVLTPLIAFVLVRSRIGLPVWGGVALSTIGLAMLSGIHAGSVDRRPPGAGRRRRVLAADRPDGALAPRYDAVAFTFVEMLAAGVALGVVAVALGDLHLPHGWTVWGALLVTGVFASALAFLVQTWAQRRTSATRTALAFTMEPVWTAFFGYTLAGDRLGLLGWGGCAVIMAGIVLAEPAAAERLSARVRLARET